VATDPALGLATSTTGAVRSRRYFAAMIATETVLNQWVKWFHFWRWSREGFMQVVTVLTSTIRHSDTRIGEVETAMAEPVFI